MRAVEYDPLMEPKIRSSTANTIRDKPILLISLIHCRILCGRSATARLNDPLEDGIIKMQGRDRPRLEDIETGRPQIWGTADTMSCDNKFQQAQARRV